MYFTLHRRNDFLRFTTSCITLHWPHSLLGCQLGGGRGQPIRHSIYGYFVLIGGNLVSWSSAHQGVISCLSVEAKYRGIANVAAKTSWLINIFCEIHKPMNKATLVYFDNVVQCISIPIMFSIKGRNTSRLTFTLFGTNLSLALFEFFMLNHHPSMPTYSQNTCQYHLFTTPKTVWTFDNITNKLRGC